MLWIDWVILNTHRYNKPNFKKIKQVMQVVGYLHVLVEKVTITESTNPVHLNIALGEVAKVNTTPKPSNSPTNEVFLIQVPKDPTRLILCGYEGEEKKGECRYDVNPFFEHEASTHKIESDLFDDDNKKVGGVILKITFYSSKHGKMRVRIFHLEFHPAMVEKFKQAKVKVRFGVHAQSTPVKLLGESFDEVVEVLILHPTKSFTFDVVHDEGILATYTIQNAEEAGMMKEESKAYQVSLFNNEKPVGLIKYQLDWLKPKTAP